MTPDDKAQIILDALFALIDAEFLLRKVAINPREAGAMADSLHRSAQDASDAIAKLRELEV